MGESKSLYSSLTALVEFKFAEFPETLLALDGCEFKVLAALPVAVAGADTVADDACWLRLLAAIDSIVDVELAIVLLPCNVEPLEGLRLLSCDVPEIAETSDVAELVGESFFS